MPYKRALLVRFKWIVLMAISLVIAVWLINSSNIHDWEGFGVFLVGSILIGAIIFIPWYVVDVILILCTRRHDTSLTIYSTDSGDFEYIESEFPEFQHCGLPYLMATEYPRTKLYHDRTRSFRISQRLIATTYRTLLAGWIDSVKSVQDPPEDR